MLTMKNETRTAVLHMRMAPGLKARLQRLAKRRKQTTSDLIHKELEKTVEQS